MTAQKGIEAHGAFKGAEFIDKLLCKDGTKL